MSLESAKKLLEYTDRLLAEENHEKVTAKSLLTQLQGVALDLPWREVVEKELEKRGEDPPRRGHVQMIALGLRDRLRSCIA